MEADRRSTKIPGPPAALKQLTASVCIYVCVTVVALCQIHKNSGQNVTGRMSHRKPMLPESAELLVPSKTDLMLKDKHRWTMVVKLPLRPLK